MNDRDRILACLRDADLEERLPLRQDEPHKGRDIETLWERFSERLEELSGKLGSLKDWDFSQPLSYWIDADAAPHLKSWQVRRVDDPWKAEVGVTMVEFAVAETGSVALSAGPGRRRLASLAPPIHLALVPSHAIVATLEEAFERMSARTSVLITGPSRTADIEGILVRGVHGPRELWVIRLEEAQGE